MMTTLSSEGSSSNSTAPGIFHVSGHVSGSTSSDGHRCPLCKKFQKCFYCKDCIQGGYIAAHFESLNSIRLSLDDLTEKKRKIEQSCLQYLENKQKADILQTKIRQVRDRNRIISLALEEKRQKKEELNQKLVKMAAENKERGERLGHFKTKNEMMEDYISRKHEDLTGAKEKLNKQYKDLTDLVRLRVEQLFQFVFPITESWSHISCRELESSGESSRPAKEKWVYADDSNEVQYKIVNPSLPGSGNYSNYTLWAKCDGVPMSEDVNQMAGNPALNIATALAYTAQLLNVLSFFLDVRLPYKIIYSEFNSTTLTEQQFSKKVAKLNANILYLCISQNVEISSLSPNKTIQNLLKLRNNKTTQLGSQLPMEMNDQQAEQLEKLIPSDIKATDSDSDEMSDWEALPQGVQCPEAAPGPATVPTSVMNSQQASSLAGGLVTSAVASVASIWRGFTGR
ncbi:beclin 1-associated autophagy-related key regulator isoform X2 [Dendroctonus ponderosae]|uniref:beclin 1-associated autophagy-related key regulator isoform X2 n=1 Tax=Dendroctonus ponderosae TaxID=77166 RepID=UPI00203576A2|nr:beclin 1-associated autophagy-related key regulator isoform X2 [Dendroctonus ponderosae]KAH1014910.1 hypothetical protein HUJ05_012718 [Dendroctonus ponderosae]KAH1014911.1 hypothetical protein HUJ05_012718 [Dendroctonus ponderosae]